MHYLKTSGVLYAYIFSMSIVAYGIILIESPTVKAILFVLNILLYCAVVAALMFKEGMDSVKVLYSNNRLRERIVETGEDIKLKRAEEYAPYKGFIFGALAYAPYVLILIVHAILTSINPTLLGAGQIGATLYMVFHAPVGLCFSGAITAGVYYIGLYGMVVISITAGIFYLLGARKIFKQHERIESYNKSIYGE